MHHQIDVVLDVDQLGNTDNKHNGKLQWKTVIGIYEGYHENKNLTYIEKLCPCGCIKIFGAQELRITLCKNFNSTYHIFT